MSHSLRFACGVKCKAIMYRNIKRHLTSLRFVLGVYKALGDCYRTKCDRAYRKNYYYLLLSLFSCHEFLALYPHYQVQSAQVATVFGRVAKFTVSSETKHKSYVFFIAENNQNYNRSVFFIMIFIKVIIFRIDIQNLFFK